METQKEYSVLLQYPDYLDTDYPSQTYYGFATAATTAEAVRAVQLEAASAQDGEDGCGGIEELANDFALLLVTVGHNPEADHTK